MKILSRSKSISISKILTKGVIRISNDADISPLTTDEGQSSKPVLLGL